MPRGRGHWSRKIAIAGILTGAASWILNDRKIACFRESYFQLHALWHLATAASAWALFRYLDQEASPACLPAYRKLRRCIAQSDLFLFPSLYETQGLVAMEAASFGLPMLAQAGAPALSTLFEDGRTAFFSSRSPEAYARRILELVHQPEQRKEVGSNAVSCVRRIEQTLSQIMEIYRQYQPQSPQVPGHGEPAGSMIFTQQRPEM